MAIDPEQIPIMSWKDKLLGKDIVNHILNRDLHSFGRDNDLELQDGDIQTTIVNGIPTIIFFDRLKNILIKEMELIVVIKLLGRSIGYNTLHNRIISHWKLVYDFHLMDIENGYYMHVFKINLTMIVF